MQDALSARQTKILKILVDEYIQTASPVGSEALDKKFNLGVSPATIRNEMVQLTKQGFLKQPHTSAGRIPTSKAMKFYIDQLMEERQMSIADEVKAKEEVWDARSDIDTLFREATQALAQHSHSLAVSAIPEEKKIWHSGYSNVFQNPEFSDISVCESLFGLIEEEEKLYELFFERLYKNPIEVFFGEELGFRNLSAVGVVSTRFSVGGKDAFMSVVGPMRISYSTVIPMVRYFSNLIREMI